MKGRHLGVWAVRLVFGLAVLAFVVSRADLHGLASNLSRVHPGWLIAMVIVPHLAIFVSVVKWRILLRHVGVTAPLRRLTILYMIGTFFNNLLPSMVGGDAVRAYQLHREKRDASGIVAATFMERYVGLAGLLTLVLFVYAEPVLLREARWLPVVLTTAGIVYLAFTLLLFSRYSAVLGRWAVGTGFASRIAGAMARTRDRIVTFRTARGPLAASYAISVLFYSLAALTVWLACRAVGRPVDLAFLSVAVPSVLLAGLMPVSVNGLGITEGGYLLFLGMAGVSTVDALSVALLVRGRILFTAVIGGICFLAYRPEGALPSARA